VRQRQAFGGPLWNQQTIRQRLSMLDAKTRAARAFMYHCAWRVTQGHDIVQDVSMLKALTGELVNEVVQTCQQFHGGMGFMHATTGSSACGATRACWASAAAPPKSCSKKSPSVTEADQHHE
jgi:alkylation response protein AidB-like acyl-CoA dehydrogenase